MEDIQLSQGLLYFLNRHLESLQRVGLDSVSIPKRHQTQANSCTGLRKVRTWTGTVACRPSQTSTDQQGRSCWFPWWTITIHSFIHSFSWALQVFNLHYWFFLPVFTNYHPPQIKIPKSSLLTFLLQTSVFRTAGLILAQPFYFPLHGVLQRCTPWAENGEVRERSVAASYT